MLPIPIPRALTDHTTVTLQKNRVYVEYTRHSEREDDGSELTGAGAGTAEEAAARRSARAPRRRP